MSRDNATFEGEGVEVHLRRHRRLTITSNAGRLRARAVDGTPSECRKLAITSADGTLLAVLFDLDGALELQLVDPATTGPRFHTQS